MQLSSWHAQQLVFIDESVFNLCTLNRKYGYKERVNTDMFNDFIQNKVLSECEQFSEPHSVLYMNNYRIHHLKIGFHTNISLFAILSIETYSYVL